MGRLTLVNKLTPLKDEMPFQEVVCCQDLSRLRRRRNRRIKFCNNFDRQLHEEFISTLQQSSFQSKVAFILCILSCCFCFFTSWALLAQSTRDTYYRSHPESILCSVGIRERCRAVGGGSGCRVTQELRFWDRVPPQPAKLLSVVGQSHQAFLSARHRKSRSFLPQK